jgi:hypothetical protein
VGRAGRQFADSHRQEQLAAVGRGQCGGVLVANVLQYREQCWVILQLLADFRTNTDSRIHAAWARLLGIGQVVFDLDSW